MITLKEAKGNNKEMFILERKLKDTIDITTLPCENQYCDNSVDSLRKVSLSNYGSFMGGYCNTCIEYIKSRMTAGEGKRFFQELYAEHLSIVGTYDGSIDKKEKLNAISSPRVGEAGHAESIMEAYTRLAQQHYVEYGSVAGDDLQVEAVSDYQQVHNGESVAGRFFGNSVTGLTAGNTSDFVFVDEAINTTNIS